jgi:hypothetical protein
MLNGSKQSCWSGLQGNVKEADADEYGQRYILDFNCERGDRSAVVRSGWIVRRGEDFLRLTTCYVLSGWGTEWLNSKCCPLWL